MIRPRVGRSRSNVTSRSSVTSAAAASMGPSPRPRIEMCRASSAERGRRGDHLEREDRARDAVVERREPRRLVVDRRVEAVDVEPRRARDRRSASADRPAPRAAAAAPLGCGRAPHRAAARHLVRDLDRESRCSGGELERRLRAGSAIELRAEIGRPDRVRLGRRWRRDGPRIGRPRATARTRGPGRPPRAARPGARRTARAAFPTQCHPRRVSSGGVTDSVGGG